MTFQCGSKERAGCSDGVAAMTRASAARIGPISGMMPAPTTRGLGQTRSPRTMPSSRTMRSPRTTRSRRTAIPGWLRQPAPALRQVRPAALGQAALGQAALSQAALSQAILSQAAGRPAIPAA
jgi:hypothetical protein